MHVIIAKVIEIPFPAACLTPPTPDLLSVSRTQTYTHTHKHVYTDRLKRAHHERGWYGDHKLICLFIRLCLPLSRGGVCLKNVPRLGG